MVRYYLLLHHPSTWPSTKELAIKWQRQRGCDSDPVNPQVTCQVGQATPIDLISELCQAAGGSPMIENCAIEKSLTYSILHAREASKWRAKGLRGHAVKHKRARWKMCNIHRLLDNLVFYTFFFGKGKALHHASLHLQSWNSTIQAQAYQLVCCLREWKVKGDARINMAIIWSSITAYRDVARVCTIHIHGVNLGSPPSLPTAISESRGDDSNEL